MQELIKRLNQNGFIVHFVQTKEEAITLSKSLITSGMIGLGGSTTVKEIGLLDNLISRDDIKLFNQYEKGI